jgi:hypothetical protein
MAGAVAAVARRAAASSRVLRWPSPRYAGDPVRFAYEVLGVRELSPAQIELLESIRDHRNTTARSGHKCGKSTALAIAALWFFCSFDRARIVISAVKADQIEKAIWAEVQRLYRASRVPLGGELSISARTGLRDIATGRQVWGMTARSPEGLAGISGPNILVLVDEASGVPDVFFEVLGSSLAGSGGTVRKCYISNPTRTTGEFWRSHTSLAHLFNRLHFSSEDTPNARGTGCIPGLAGPEWIAEKKLEYGEDSYAYRVRVRGEFVADKDGKIISLNEIQEARDRWDETPAEGPMQVGVDPAGDGIGGDEIAVAVRRGRKLLTVRAMRGLDEDGIASWVIAMVREFKRGNEDPPRVCIDAEGGIGTRVLEKLRAHLETDRGRGEFAVVEVRGGKKFFGSPEFHLVRDGLWGHMREWIRAGGALPDDERLATDLNAPAFTPDTDQRYRATDKVTLRKELGRSPDRGDAACLATWRWRVHDVQAPEASFIPAVAPSPAAEQINRRGLAGRRAPEDAGYIDPYAAAGIWSQR